MNIKKPLWSASHGTDTHGQFAIADIAACGSTLSQVMRWIAPGQFTMGSPVAETENEPEEFQEWLARERPQHSVTISEGFWLADTACTQALWEAVMGENPSHFDAKNKGGPDHPVERVSWNMIQQFLQKLERLLPGCRATLPTEAEWEYACRAGSSTPFSFGEMITTGQVNYHGDYPYGDAEKGPWRNHTVGVKELPVNAWGLYQMHGNVWEWCADEPREYGVDAVLDPGLAQALAPVLDDTVAHILRGGSGWENAFNARSANRFELGPDWRSGYKGFRFVIRL